MKDILDQTTSHNMEIEALKKAVVALQETVEIQRSKIANLESTKYRDDKIKHCVGKIKPLEQPKLSSSDSVNLVQFKCDQCETAFKTEKEQKLHVELEHNEIFFDTTSEINDFEIKSSQAKGIVKCRTKTELIKLKCVHCTMKMKL